MGRTGRSLWSTLNYGSHGPVEIVDLPHEKMVDLSIVLVFPEGVSEMKSHDLVGGLEHDVFFFHNIWDNGAYLLSYFSRWLKPPSSN